MNKKITIEETPEQKANREMIAVIAGNISALARSVKSLVNGPLSKRALIVLLASSSSMPQSKVADVLKALEDFEKDWLNK